MVESHSFVNRTNTSTTDLDVYVVVIPQVQTFKRTWVKTRKVPQEKTQIYNEIPIARHILQPEIRLSEIFLIR